MAHKYEAKGKVAHLWINVYGLELKGDMNVYDEGVVMAWDWLIYIVIIISLIINPVMFNDLLY